LTRADMARRAARLLGLLDLQALAPVPPNFKG
jgi:hypothetical protein